MPISLSKTDWMPRSASDEMISKVLWERFVPVACAAVSCVILTAGLWPFNPHPRNNVAWLRNANGLRFGGHGTILSTRAFEPPDAAAGVSCTLEILAEARSINHGGTLLGFYSPENLVSFSIFQYKQGAIFRRRTRDRQGHVVEAHFGVDRAFHPARASIITITASAQATSAYVDGF